MPHRARKIEHWVGQPEGGQEGDQGNYDSLVREKVGLFLSPPNPDEASM